MNLLQRKAQIKLAQQGVELLRNKRDALLKEFMSEVQPLLSARNEAQKELCNAIDALIISLAIDGTEKVQSAAFVYAEELSIKIEERNIWGIKVPHIKPAAGPMRSPFERGYAITETSTRIDETAASFKTLIDLVIKMAPIEIKLKRLGQEIRKTSRRVNALELVLIPNLARELRFIRDTLEERAREDIFRLKRLKGRKK